MAIKILGNTVIDDSRNITNINTTATGNTTITGFINVSSDAVISGNVAIGGAIQTDTTMYISDFWSTDATTTGLYVYGQDQNTSLTAIRNRYAVFGYLTNRSQNKNVDGVTTYNSNYRAVVGDALNGSSSSGGNAFASELIGGNFRSYQYANGTAANSINVAVGARNQSWQYGSGIITNAFGTQSLVSAGNNSVTGNISSAYGSYAGITSNTSSTIGNGYLFYGEHLGSTTSTKWGVYLTGETKSYFSGNVGIGNTAPSHRLRVDGTTSLAGAVSDITTLAAGNTTITGFINVSTTAQIGGNLTLASTSAIIANSSTGTAGQVLTTSGSEVYWSSASGGVNAAAQYAWTNTHTFSVGANAITFSNATSNWIYYDTAGVAAPTNTTRSAGTKLVLYPSISSTGVDYGIGIESGAMWFSSYNTGTGFKWYSNTTNIMSANTSGVNAASYYVGTTLIGNSTGPYGKTEGNLNVNTASTASALTITSIPGSTDLNSYTTTGTYHQSTNVNAASGTNYPVASAGLLEVYAFSLMIYQRYTVYNTGEIWTRSYYNGTWYAWDLVLDDGNFNSYAPTLTGGGASGTWSINVTGSAGSAASATNSSQLGGVAAASYARKDQNETFSANVTAGSMFTSNWFRSTGTTGWYSETYGGGIYMNDTTQVKTYNNKRFWAGAFAGTTAQSTDTSQLQLQNGGGTGDNDVAAISFHCAGYYGMKLHLRADGYFGWGGWSASAWRFYQYLGNGDVTAAGNITAYSDIRLKENITPLENSLDKIKKLNGVRFTWKDLPDIVGAPGKADFGILAHEVEAVAPELISQSPHESPDGDRYKTVAYDKLVPILIEAVKDLSGQVEYLKEELKKLKGE